MIVKKIYFVPSVPGFPIYEMDNGDLRCPFPNGSTKEMLWLTEAEVLNTVNNPTDDRKNNIKLIFANVAKEVKESETLVYGMNNKPVAKIKTLN